MNEAMQLLSKRLTGLLVKRPGLALGVWGEAGIGKTHTVSSLLREIPCRNASVHATLPVAQWLQRLPQAKKLPVWAEHRLERVNAGEFVEASSVIDLLGVVLCAQAPIIVYVEDLHEASQDSLQSVQALAVLVKRLKGVGLIVTSRTEPGAAFENLRLEPLSYESMRDVLEAGLSAALPLKALAWLFDRTRGHPLFSLELMRHLIRMGNLWNNTQEWLWHVPEKTSLPVTIEALIEHSLGLIIDQPFVSQALYAKALIPRDSSLEFWQNTAQLGAAQLQAAILTLTQTGFLHRAQLSHPLFQELTLRTMPAAQRREMARRIMCALSETPTEAIAYLQLAALGHDEQRVWFGRAIDFAIDHQNVVMVADLVLRAADVFSPDEQTALARKVVYDLCGVDLSKAAELFAHMDRAVKLDRHDTYRWAQVLAQIGRLDRAEVLLEGLPECEKAQPSFLEQSIQVLGLAEHAVKAVAIWDANPALQQSGDAEFLLLVAKSLITVSRLPEAASILGRALLLAPSSRAKANVLLMRGVLRNFGIEDATFNPAQDLRLALSLCEEIADSAGIARAHHCIAMHWYYNGLPRSALMHGATAKVLYEKMGSQQYWKSSVLVCAIQIELGLYQEAERGLLEANTHLLQSSMFDLRVWTSTNLSYLYRHWAVPYGPTLSLKFARQAFNIAREEQNLRSETNALYHLSKSETLFGHAQEGLNLADRALELAEELNYPVMQAYPWHARYQALKALGRQPEAINALIRAESALRRQGHLQDADFYRVELEAQTGNLQQARVYLEKLRTNENHAFVQMALRSHPELEPEPNVIAARQPNNSHVQILGRPQLEVLGAMRFNAGPVKGRKRQELLAVLLEARIANRSEINRLDLIDLLYPDAIEAQASSSLKENVRGIRASLGADVIQTSTNGYALGGVSSDAEQFLQTADTHLWRGAYLEGFTLETSDETVRESLHLALLARAKNLLETDALEAARVGKILLAFDPYNLEYLELNLLALRSSNNHKSLARLYSQARNEVAGLGEALPERWQDFLSARAGTVVAP